MKDIQNYCSSNLVSGIEKYRNVENLGITDLKEVYEDRCINVLHPSRFVTILFLVYHYEVNKKLGGFTTKNVWDFYCKLRKHPLWNTRNKPKSRTSLNHALNKLMGLGLIQRRKTKYGYEFSITDIVSKYGLSWFFSNKNRFEEGGYIKGIPKYLNKSNYVRYILRALKKYEIL